MYPWSVCDCDSMCAHSSVCAQSLCLWFHVLMVCMCPWFCVCLWSMYARGSMYPYVAVVRVPTMFHMCPRFSVHDSLCCQSSKCTTDPVGRIIQCEALQHPGPVLARTEEQLRQVPAHMSPRGPGNSDASQCPSGRSLDGCHYQHLLTQKQPRLCHGPVVLGPQVNRVSQSEILILSILQASEQHSGLFFYQPPMPRYSGLFPAGAKPGGNCTCTHPALSERTVPHTSAAQRAPTDTLGAGPPFGHYLETTMLVQYDCFFSVNQSYMAK